MAGVVLHGKRPAVPLSDSHLLLHFLPAARLQSAIHPILSKLGVIHYFIFPPLVAFSLLLLQFQNRFWSRGNGKQEKHLHWSLNLKEFSDKLFRPFKTSFSSYPSAVIGLQGFTGRGQRAQRMFSVELIKMTTPLSWGRNVSGKGDSKSVHWPPLILPLGWEPGSQAVEYKSNIWGHPWWPRG